MSGTVMNTACDLSETIVALATPSGRGALAIVRLAGPRAHDIARATLSRWPDRSRQIVLSGVVDAESTVLDESVVIRYDAPASFTGEDAVEIITHGGLVVPTTIVAALVAAGARLAQRGEFTRRAVLNGKLDIVQAEATGDLIAADSRAAQRIAVQQLDGGLSRRVLALRDELIGVEALIAYDIDFPEEDDGPIAPTRILAAVDALIVALENLLATSRGGELVREGAVVVLAGAPNVGKSSLFNALIGQRRAIVTDVPGTTRDAIEAVIDTPTIPLRLVDTAGLRTASDLVERLGVEMSREYLGRADVVLVCVDSVENARAFSEAMALSLNGVRAPTIAVRTKSDLVAPGHDELTTVGAIVGSQSTVAVSAETGAGIDELLRIVERAVATDALPKEPNAPLLTRERHRYAVSRALEEIRAFREHWAEAALPASVAAVHLQTAVMALEDLIGVVNVDDVLDEVFRRFCVGK